MAGLWSFFWIVWVIGLLIVLTYGLGLFFGAPYLPTLKDQRRRALDLLELKPGQVFVDLGSGDGTMLAFAASRGLQAVGYEINPFLVAISWVRTRRYGGQVKIKPRSFWGADLSQADGVFVFLITHHMKRFDKYMAAQAKHKKIKLVSNAFVIPGRKHLKKSGSMFLYQYGPLAR